MEAQVSMCRLRHQPSSEAGNSLCLARQKEDHTFKEGIAGLWDTIKSLFTYRSLIHQPGGILNGLLLVFYPEFGIAFLIGFLVYEVTQCWKIASRAQAYKDIIGHLVGMAAVGISFLCLYAAGIVLP